jgi:C4-dicarboxylate-specific signal transduction histidine kinase
MKDVCALLDALPMPAMLTATDGTVLHANPPMRATECTSMRPGLRLSLPGIGECLLVVEPIDVQTQRLASLGFMLAGVCHEVSNPLAAVHSMLQILQSKRGVTPETLEKGLASMSANLARVLAITKKLGDFSRVGGERPVPVSIDSAVDEAIVLLRYGYSDTQVEYRGAPGARALARPGSLQQVLFNILLNAAQAMDGGGRIFIRAAPDGDGKLELEVRDTGPGIASEHLGRVFEPFFTTKPAGEGTGLGLAISEEIAHELGGALRVSNHPEGGARFALVLPLYRG